MINKPGPTCTRLLESCDHREQNAACNKVRESAMEKTKCYGRKPNDRRIKFQQLNGPDPLHAYTQIYINIT